MSDRPGSCIRLLELYLQVTMAYAFGLWLLWKLGIEGIYGHPTPFYAFPLPARPNGAALFIAFALVCAFVYILRAELDRCLAGDDAALCAHRRFLMATVIFAVLFPASVASLRGGLDAIALAYSRQAYEYIGDIGKAPSIPVFLARYNELHPYLSMHAKVHPPGPVVALWVLSWFVGTTPFALSCATIVAGALAILPLYHFANDLFGRLVATIAAALYALVPSIVLFTATSTDILFTPVTLTTLFLFWRAIERRSWRYALAAGMGYALMSLLSYSLIGLGVFFGIVGLWKLGSPLGRVAVIQTAAAMLAAFIAVHAALRYSTGFDVIENFVLSKQQFDQDQRMLDQLDPRLPSLAWKILNPLAWAYFFGLPVSVLGVLALMRLRGGHGPIVAVFALTAVALNFLYLARGEGERSAMYIVPFVVIPGAAWLAPIVREGQKAPVLATASVLAAQCAVTELLFFTYW